MASAYGAFGATGSSEHRWRGLSFLSNVLDRGVKPRPHRRFCVQRGLLSAMRLIVQEHLVQRQHLILTKRDGVVDWNGEVHRPDFEGFLRCVIPSGGPDSGTGQPPSDTPDVIDGCGDWRILALRKRFSAFLATVRQRRLQGLPLTFVQLNAVSLSLRPGHRRLRVPVQNLSPCHCNRPASGMHRSASCPAVGIGTVPLSGAGVA